MHHAVPLMHILRRHRGLQAAPAADIPKSQQHQRQESGDDEEELQDLVVDGAGQSAEEDIRQHDDGRKHDGERENSFLRPAQRVKESIKNMQRLDQPRHRVHRDAGTENRHHRKGAGIQRAGLLVEPHAQELRHRAGLGAVIKRHHEDAHKDHSRNRADAIEVRGLQAVFGAGSAHADDFLRAQVGADKGQAADPRGQGAAGLEEILAGLHIAFQGKANAQHEDEVQQHDQPVNGGKVHEQLLESNILKRAFGNETLSSQSLCGEWKKQPNHSIGRCSWKSSRK